jgi:hypothetical protein
VEETREIKEKDDLKKVVFFVDLIKKSLQDVRTMKKETFVKVGEMMISRKNVEFIDIEECGITGNDILTFSYKNNIYKSYLYLS